MTKNNLYLEKQELFLGNDTSDLGKLEILIRQGRGRERKTISHWSPTSNVFRWSFDNSKPRVWSDSFSTSYGSPQSFAWCSYAEPLTVKRARESFQAGLHECSVPDPLRYLQ